jgi:hypothetical protein
METNLLNRKLAGAALETQNFSYGRNITLRRSTQVSSLGNIKGIYFVVITGLILGAKSFFLLSFVRPRWKYVKLSFFQEEQMKNDFEAQAVPSALNY